MNNTIIIPFSKKKMVKLTGIYTYNAWYCCYYFLYHIS